MAATCRVGIQPHQAGILLLDKAVIIFVIGATARKLDACDLVQALAHQVLVEELGAIIWMQFEEGKRDALQDPPEAAFHCRLPSPQDRYPLTPACRDIDQLDGMPILACGTLPCMMHQVHLFMSRLSGVPGNAFHGHSFPDLVGSLWPFAWQALLALTVLAQEARDRGFADLSQLLLHLLGQAHTAEAGQMLGSRE
jgi:hypothetical protein